MQLPDRFRLLISPPAKLDYALIRLEAFCVLFGAWLGVVPGVDQSRGCHRATNHLYAAMRGVD